MLYAESVPQSAELLRLVLSSICRHGGTFVPTSYAVWYEHLAGTNAGLSRHLVQQLECEKSLDPVTLAKLHSEHIAARDVCRSRSFQNSLAMLVRQIEQVVATSSGGADRFAQTLEAGHSELQTLTDANDLRLVLQRLLDATREARGSVDVLRVEIVARQLELQQARTRLGHLESEAVKDPLTGLLNRRGFDQAVSKAAGDGHDPTRSSVLMIDLDHFKCVNDSYGHLFGDQVLCSAARLLTGLIKGRDIAARFGGEEFVVLRPETPQYDAVRLAEEFRMAFNRTKWKRTGSDQVVNHLSASIGVSYPRPGETIDSAIARADAALYAAKNAGRNCVRVAPP